MIYELVRLDNDEDVEPTPPKPPHLHHHVDLALIALCLCNAVDAVETMAFSSILPGYRVGGQHLTSLQSSVITAAVFTGMLFGGLCAGYLADACGRRPVLVACMLVNGASAVLSALTSLVVEDQVYWLALCRLVAGLGVGGSVPSVFALTAELTTPLTSSLGRRVALLAASWTVGSVFTSAAAWLVMGSDGDGDNSHTWPAFLLVCSLPAWLAVGMTWCFVEEEETVDRRDDEELTTTTTSRATVAIYALLFFTANFGSYGPLTWMAKVFVDLGYKDPFFIQLVSALSALAGNALAYGALTSAASLRRVLLLGLCGASASCWAFQLPYAPPAWLCSCSFSLCTSLIWTSLGAMSSTAFTYASRATQLGLVVSCGRLGSILANAVNPTLQQHDLLLPVAGLALALGAAVIAVLF